MQKGVSFSLSRIEDKKKKDFIHFCDQSWFSFFPRFRFEGRSIYFVFLHSYFFLCPSPFTSFPFRFLLFCLNLWRVLASLIIARSSNPSSLVSVFQLRTCNSLEAWSVHRSVRRVRMCENAHLWLWLCVRANPYGVGRGLMPVSTRQ